MADGSAPILLAHDDEDEVALLTRVLTADRRRLRPVIVARTAAEAIERAAGEAERRPCILAVHAELPEEGGLEVLRRIRAIPGIRYLPVLVFGAGSLEQVHSAYALGANSYVRRPESLADLVEFASVLGQYWQDLNQWPVVG